MKTRIILENWTKLDSPEYRQVVELQHIPRIGERITFEKEDTNGNYEYNLYVIDIVNQFIDGYHNIIIIISNDLDSVNSFHYHED